MCVNYSTQQQNTKDMNTEIAIITVFILISTLLLFLYARQLGLDKGEANAKHLATLKEAKLKAEIEKLKAEIRFLERESGVIDQEKYHAINLQCTPV